MLGQRQRDRHDFHIGHTFEIFKEVIILISELLDAGKHYITPGRKANSMSLKAQFCNLTF
jgi:hypothetical protein